MSVPRPEETRLFRPLLQAAAGIARIGGAGSVSAYRLTAPRAGTSRRSHSRILDLRLALLAMGSPGTRLLPTRGSAPPGRSSAPTVRVPWVALGLASAPLRGWRCPVLEIGEGDARNRLPQGALDSAKVPFLLLRHERDRFPFRLHPRGPTDAVHVVRGEFGDVVVDHLGDRLHVGLSPKSFRNPRSRLSRWGRVGGAGRLVPGSRMTLDVFSNCRFREGVEAEAFTSAIGS